MAEVNIDVVSTGNNDPILAVGEMLSDEIVAASVSDMVYQIIARLGPSDRINRLRLFGHGAPGMICIGDIPAGLTLESNEEVLSRHSLSTIRCFGHRTPNGEMRYFLLNADVLAQISNRFAPRGRAELHSCHVAEREVGEELLKKLAAVWRVSVAAGTGDQIPGGGLENTIVVAQPNGHITRRLPPPPPAPQPRTSRERVTLP